ncbi:hypothetical protein MMC06_005306, partial [Schaereria dolodes]|nr:hypothetical protein [Schaereria dolodes]
RGLINLQKGRIREGRAHNHNNPTDVTTLMDRTVPKYLGQPEAATEKHCRESEYAVDEVDSFAISDLGGNT